MATSNFPGFGRGVRFRPEGLRFARFLAIGFASCLTASEAPDLQEAARIRFHQQLEVARVRLQADTRDAAAAVEIGRAASECAELATNKTERSRFAEEGIAGCRLALDLQPKLGAAHYYLGLNLGLLSQTRGLSALGLVSDMEKELLRAIEFDPLVNLAGPHRTLGLLYLNAPGWPLSVGDNKKSQKHLAQAVALRPDVPENHLALLESRLRLKQRKEIQRSLPQVEAVLAKARSEFTGEDWALPWQEWEARWAAAQAKAKALLSP